MAFQVASIDPSKFISVRDEWLKDSKLDSVGADRLFESCSLSELVEMNNDELKEYGDKIGLTDIEKERLINGINALNTIEQPGAIQSPKSPKTPKSPKVTLKKLKGSKSKNGLAPRPKSARPSSSGKKKKSKGKSKGSRKDNRIRSKSNAKMKKSPALTRKSSSSSDAPMYDPTGRTGSGSVSSTLLTTTMSPKKTDEGPTEFAKFEVQEIPKDMTTQINEAMARLNSDANLTRDDIRKTFMEFKQKLAEREMRLLHDVDATVEKKTRLLQTQLDYVKDNPDATDLACEPQMRLLIKKPEILRVIMTAGWVLGAASGIFISYYIQNCILFILAQIM